MPKVVAIVIARMGSTRLPGKVLMPLEKAPVLEWVCAAAHVANNVDEVWVATTCEERDYAIAEFVAHMGNTGCHRGSETDVLERVHDCAVLAQADLVIRITGDCPFQDPAVIDQLVALQKHTGAAYVSNVNPATWPDGLDCEVFTMEALAAAHKEATIPSDRDTVTQYIARNRERWPSQTLICPIPGMHRERWVLDTQEDYKFCQAVAERCHYISYQPPSYTDILKILDAEPKLRFINQTSRRNERFLASTADELDTTERSYQRSRAMLERSLKVTPYGAGTYSKSHVAYGKENGPLYLSHGDGGWAFDVDGNRYVDLVSGLTATILGHCDPDVDAAVRDQLNSGVSFSLGTALEAQLAEKLSTLIPCAEMTMFCKNGSDATAAAVRLARGITRRENIVMFDGAYHGWHDWSLTPPRDYGVYAPDTVLLRLDQTIRVLDKHAKSTAAVVVEPDQHSTKDLIDIRIWCTQHDALLIFDECVTGFRYPGGSYQMFSAIVPDLAAFGKGMANGYPLSALCGPERHMKRIAPGDEPNIFFSGTHFGEALALRAGIETVAKIWDYNVPSKLYDMAEILRDDLLNIAENHKVRTLFDVGPPPLCRITWETPQAAASFRHHMAQAGVLIYGYLGLNFAHTENDIHRVRLAFEYALGRIAAGDLGYSVPQTGIMRR